MKYLSRKKVFEDPIFASFISAWQDIENPSKNNTIEAGEYYDEETDSVRFFSKTELDKAHEKEITDFKNKTDHLEKKEIEMLAKIVIEAPNNSDDVKFLSKTMALFAKKNELEFTFIPLFKLPWLHEDIKEHHPLTKEAFNNFKTLIKEKAYSEGILVSDYLELKNMLLNYFNLIQGNYFGYNFFYAKTIKTVFSFHYTGQIWFYVYSQEALNIIEAFISKNNLIINQNYTTYNT